MKVSADIYRSDGQWIVELEAEAWILDDILFDGERKKTMPVKVIITREKEYVSGGTTHFMNRATAFEVEPPTDMITADVLFEEVP